MTHDQSLFCSDLSASVGEQLYCSTPRIGTWLLLEYPYPYGAKAIEESQLSDQIKSHLSAVQKLLPDPRLLFIKKKNELSNSKISFFMAAVSEHRPHLYRLQLDSYDDLLHLDFSSLSREGSTLGAYRVEEPIFLICTNGKRDRCCAKNGLPLYEAVSNDAPEQTWQCSHVGGHRFAGNLICLPHGLYYGRVPIDRGTTIVEAYRSGHIVLENLRGRAVYHAHQQAAEYYFREYTGDTRIDGFRMVSSQEVDQDHWIITIETSQGNRYQLKIYADRSDYEIFESCNNPANRTQQRVYYLQSIKAE